MKIGMFWFDNEKNKTLDTKVSEAITYYQEKYGKRPTIAFCNPTQYTGGESEETTCAGITLKPSRSVMPNHVWVGVQ